MKLVTAEQCHILWPAGIALRHEGQKNQRFHQLFIANESLIRMRQYFFFD
jgi:hypothetical protein